MSGVLGARHIECKECHHIKRDHELVDVNRKPERVRFYARCTIPYCECKKFKR